MPVTDARGLPSDSLIQADLVIIGGGIAGLILAHELAGSAMRVAILEGGGLQPDPEIQKLYDGPALMKGPGNPDRAINSYLGQSRVRALGGSGHVWGGKCGPLDAVDFAARAWRPLSGWPFGRKELKPFYDRACDRLKLPRFPEDGGLPQGTQQKPVGEASSTLRSSPRAYSPLSGRVDAAAFKQFCEAAAQADNIEIYLHANVTGIRLNASGQVDHLEVRCLSGTQMKARGRRYVLAAGGVENARLLLASNKEQPNGVANAA
ncbi:MAG: GMC family oxidoreductase, partial [Caulobacter sp.]